MFLWVDRYGEGGSFNLNSQVEVNVVTMRVEVAGNDAAV